MSFWSYIQNEDKPTKTNKTTKTFPTDEIQQTKIVENGVG
jgi:hypothetical protein